MASAQAPPDQVKPFADPAGDEVSKYTKHGRAAQYVFGFQPFSALHSGAKRVKMCRSHRVIFFLIALLAVGTFVFGILQLLGWHR